MPLRSFWNFSAKLQIAFLAPNFHLFRISRLWRPCSVKTSAKLLRRDTSQFAMLCEAVLQRGLQVRFLAHGQSMQPNVLNGDAVIAEQVAASELRRGDIALTLGAHGVLLHRVIGLDPKTNRIITRGDAGQQDDTPAALVLGRAVCLERDGKRISLHTPGTKLLHAIRRHYRRVVQAGTRRMHRFRGVLGPCAVVLLATLLHAAPVFAQAITITNTAAPPATVAPGGTITYTQVLANGSGVAITKPLTTTQNLPANTTFVSAAKTAGNQNWTCTNTAGVITCNNTSATTCRSGDTTTFTIVVTVNAATANGSVISDTVSAAGANTATVTATANVTVQVPALSVSGTATPNPVATGGQITYAETVTKNSPPPAANGAPLPQPTPANTTFVSATPPGTWTCGTTPAAGGTGAI